MLAKLAFFYTVLRYASCSYPFDTVDQYVDQFEKQLGKFKQQCLTNFEFKERYLSLEVDNATDIIDLGEYDFVIVGGGTSGSVIANKLSEVPEWKILLLEAGDNPPEEVKVPSMYNYLKSGRYTWGFATTAQEHSCLGMNDRKCAVPVPKVLGGSSSINSMIYTRGNPRDYDLWADMDLKGWCWASMLPYFKKLEDAHLDDKCDNKYHRYGGPVHVEHPRHRSELLHHLLKAGEEVGMKEIDLNGKEHIGFGVPQLMAKEGKRIGVVDAYLKLCGQRKNLDVKLGSEVLKVIVGEHTKETSGVEFLHQGQLYSVRASKEVILSAGAINTAKLLLLSGLGPKEDLDEVKVNHLIDLKVGRNLKDHVIFNGLSYMLNQTESKPPCEYSESTDYLRNGKGPLTSPGIELIGFIKTNRSKVKQDAPDVEIFVTKDIYEQRLVNLRLKPDLQETLFTSPQHKQGFTLNLMLLHPKSKGSLKLKDNDPLCQPDIDLNSLSDEDEEDIDTLLAGVRQVQQLIETDEVQKLGVKANYKKLPACNKHEFDSDDYWKCAIRHLSSNAGHVTGSARMGSPNDERAVVDLKLKVHGVSGLRVADDSVIPVTISGHLTALKLAIGERASELILEEWLK
ncbi:glucose dehydrogenase [FAD, quinone]-like [Cylas formicarius]|uniref:glucose dehydrogenase [FAD, quinone]-like n=1 Tax=Cylas formicarius TaxID=197179 RepID=UPI002958C0B2|nr:glucose dehydrogenase [FAD, quinone]-like [Cylas formicarius]